MSIKKEKQNSAINIVVMPGDQSKSLEPEFIQGTLPDSQQWISDSAYFKALARGFKPAMQVSDWLEAEKEYQSMMSRQWKSGLVRLR